jgi:hypothetical protein
MYKSHNPGTTQTAALMEEEIQDIALSDCQVWRMDVEHYNLTGEVRKLEFIRTEEQSKLTAHKKGAHFVWDKDSGIKGARA